MNPENKTFSQLDKASVVKPAELIETLIQYSTGSWGISARVVAGLIYSTPLREDDLVIIESAAIICAENQLVKVLPYLDKVGRERFNSVTNNIVQYCAVGRLAEKLLQEGQFITEPEDLSNDMRGFHIGDILTVVTGRSLSPRSTVGVYDILNFLTGNDMATHDLDSVLKECQPHLILQHPQLKEVDTQELGSGNWRQWLSDQARRYGLILPVKPI